MALLEEYIENVRGMVREANNPIYDSGVDQYEDYIRRALRRYSIDKPLVKSASITGTSSEYFIVNTSNLPDFVEFWSSIERMEVKAPTIASNEDPNYIERDQWEFYRNATALYVHFIGFTPTASETISVTYTVPHTINNLDSETTDSVPSVDFEAVVYYACNLTCMALASKFAGTSDPTLRADVVNYKTKSAEYIGLAKMYRDVYMEWISDPIKAASLVRDIDFGYGFADNQPFMTHRSFSRS